MRPHAGGNVTSVVGRVIKCRYSMISVHAGRTDCRHRGRSIHVFRCGRAHPNHCCTSIGSSTTDAPTLSNKIAAAASVDATTTRHRSLE